MAQQYEQRVGQELRWDLARWAKDGFLFSSSGAATATAALAAVFAFNTGTTNAATVHSLKLYSTAAIHFTIQSAAAVPAGLTAAPKRALDMGNGTADGSFSVGAIAPVTNNLGYGEGIIPANAMLDVIFPEKYRLLQSHNFYVETDAIAATVYAHIVWSEDTN